MITETYNLTKLMEINASPNENIKFTVDFFPTKDSLPTNLLKIKEIFSSLKNSKCEFIRLNTNSSFILLLIPLILPIKDRLTVEFSFEENSNNNFYNSSYEDSKNFKDILEASLVLSKIGIKYCYNKTVSSN